MLRKFVLTAASVGALGVAALASTPAQAGGPHLGAALRAPVIETPVVNAHCIHRRHSSRVRCWHDRWDSRWQWRHRWHRPFWHGRWESRWRWHDRWRSRRWWW
jgi:hypothetical protein